MTRDLVVGVESIEFCTIVNGIAQNDWFRIENIEEGSVVVTSNKDTQTAIKPEDKTSAILILYTPGDADVFTFGMLEISYGNAKRYFNVVYDPATSKITILSKKKYANLGLRITTTPQLGYKHRFTYPNTTSVPSWKNNFAKAATLVLSVDASILPFTDTASGEDAVAFIELLHEDGSVVDSTAPTVSAGSDSTGTAGTPKALTGTATASGSKTIITHVWTQKSGPNEAGFSAPTALNTNATGLIAGTYVFTLTAVDSESISNSDDISIVVS